MGLLFSFKKIIFTLIAMNGEHFKVGLSYGEYTVVHNIATNNRHNLSWLAPLAGVWLRAIETEISTALWATGPRDGKDLRDSVHAIVAATARKHS